MIIVFERYVQFSLFIWLTFGEKPLFNKLKLMLFFLQILVFVSEISDVDPPKQRLSLYNHDGIFSHTVPSVLHLMI